MSLFIDVLYDYLHHATLEEIVLTRFALHLYTSVRYMDHPFPPPFTIFLYMYVKFQITHGTIAHVSRAQIFASAPIIAVVNGS